MLKPILALTALCTLSACAANATEAGFSEAQPPAVADQAGPEFPTDVAPAPLSCAVVARRTSHGLELEARAQADAPFEGSYRFVIRKSGRAGSTDLEQGGPIALEDGARATLGHNEISAERGARVHAELTLADEDGVACSDEFRL